MTAVRWDGERWVWIELTFRVMEATLAGRALSVREVIVALAEHRDVSFTRYIAGEWITAPYSQQDADFRAALARCGRDSAAKSR